MIKAIEIKKILNKLSIEKNVEILDVQCINKNDEFVITVFIDKKNGVTLNDCEEISYVFKKVIDKSMIIIGHYVLEISSPGINRILKSRDNFKRFIGCIVKINTIEFVRDKKYFLGKLLNFDNDIVTIDDFEKGIIEIEFLNILTANIKTDV
jgi:ribosome maturation factor RimP